MLASLFSYRVKSAYDLTLGIKILVIIAFLSELGSFKKFLAPIKHIKYAMAAERLLRPLLDFFYSVLRALFAATF